MGTSKRGYQAGLGVEYTVTAAFNLRTEFVYTRYVRISGLGNIVSGQFGVGGIYRFC